MPSFQLDGFLRLVIFIATSGIVYAGFKIVYNLYFHPLKNIPGPRAAAISNVPYSISLLSGRRPYNLRELHNKYGPVVRIAPNEVSFNTAQSWKDIYERQADGKIFIKGNFYAGGSYAGIGTTSVVSERNPHVHRQMRSLLSNAFSDRSLSEQESLISSSIDKFISLVGTKSSISATDDTKSFDLTALLEMLTFDVAGDLAFGQTFGCLDNDLYHPWISIAMGALTQGAIVDILNRFPVVSKFITTIFHYQVKSLTEDTRKNEALALAAVQRRMKNKSDRKDFLTRILAPPTDIASPTVPPAQQIAAHASDLVIAGSETSATTLATSIYYLLRTPRALAALQAEVRGGDGDAPRFRSGADLTFQATASLEYLHAVLLESLRLMPPVPLGLPRIVPAGGAVVDGHMMPAGATVSTAPIAASHSPSNFHDPLAFKPERWLGKNEHDMLAASQPFSLGPRACIGRNMAWMEMRTTLARLVWTYDFELLDQSLDWQRDAKMHTLWKKPHLIVRAFPRSVSG